MGTVGYMSPEQVRGQEADHRSDIFAFGVILYEMLSGRRAFTGESVVEVMSAILKEEPPELSETNAEDQSRVGKDRAALFGEEAGAAISVGERFGLCARGAVNAFRLSDQIQLW